MRPLVLKVRGLRSYLGEEEFRFDDRDLVAIVGDTAAGKSSILEGLCFALYGKCTWSERESSVLVSDGAQSLSAELTFRADGAKWKVSRTVPAPGRPYPPSRHQLECLDDGTRFDNDTAVSNQIKRLVGLDQQAFLRAVVLPQGRFQALLHAQPTERTRLLKGIFRVDEIESARDRAQGLLQTVRGTMAEIEIERAKLLPDPSESARQAADRLADARASEARLAAAAATVANCRTTASDAWRRKTEVEAALAALEDRRVDGAEEQLEALSQLSDELTAARSAAESARVAAATRRAGLAAEQAAALSGLTFADVAGACVALEHAARDLEAVDRNEVTLGQRREALTLRAAALSASETGIEKLRDMEERASADSDAAAGRAREAESELALAATRLATARQARQDESDAAAALHAALLETNEAEVALAASAARLALADAEVADAVAALEMVRRKDAAAFAAHGKHPGDSCPVCARALDEGWVAPAVQGEDAARAQLDRANQERGVADDERLKATANLSAARATAEGAESKHATVQQALATATEALHNSLPGVDVVADDATVLLPLTSVLANQRRLAEEAKAAADEATRQLAAEEGRLDPERRALADDQAAIDDAQAQLERSRATLAAVLEGIPTELRPREIAPASLRAAAADANGRRAKAERVQAAIDDAAADENHQLAEGQRLADRFAWEVGVPLNAIRMRLMALATQGASTAATLGMAAPALPQDDGIAATAAWSRALDQAVAGVHAAGEAAMAAAHGESTRAELELRAAFDAVGAANEVELSQLQTTSAANGQTAARDLQQAEDQVGPARALDVRIAAGLALRAALADVAALLQDSKFLGFIMQRRQVALLGVASELFGGMTGGRFGFANDFRVVDRHTGQPRPVQTLSGGETFLASLSLALALVELAGRSHGRLEALFLDEGFATLDSNALAQAIEALRAQATGGRLVAVISHLRAVAESFEHVMLVWRDAAGSHHQWLEPTQREALIDDDARSGLLA